MICRATDAQLHAWQTLGLGDVRKWLNDETERKKRTPEPAEMRTGDRNPGSGQQETDQRNNVENEIDRHESHRE